MGSLLPESIDVAAGLVFVYLFMSMVATIGREALEAMLRTRAKHLEKGLVELLCERPAGTKGKPGRINYQNLQNFYDHPLIMSLYRGRYTIPPKRNPLNQVTLPSYIPSGHFAYAVLDLMAEAGGQTSAGNLDLGDIAAGAGATDNRKLGKMVQFAVNNASGDLDKARAFIESWFNATMDRVSGAYRRETQTVLFWISLIFCIILNVNTVVIADNLWRSPSLRKTLEAQAEAYYNNKPSAIDSVVAQPVNGSSASAVDAAAVVTETRAAAKVPSAETPPASKLDKAPPAATLVTGRDIPGLLSTTDPLEKLGLPIGWNAQTITAMHRLFPAGPLVSASEADRLHRLRSMDFKAKDPFDWVELWFSHVGQLWQDTIKAYQDNGQDPTRNALFNLAGVLALICGWVMTAFAVTLGAPFWFDVLGKLMVVRSTMKPGEKGSTDMNGLSAIAAALASPDGAAAAANGQAYTPNFATSGAAASVAGNAGGDLLGSLDPGSRPRDP